MTFQAMLLGGIGAGLTSIFIATHCLHIRKNTECLVTAASARQEPMSLNTVKDARNRFCHWIRRVPSEDVLAGELYVRVSSSALKGVFWIFTLFFQSPFIAWTAFSYLFYDLTFIVPLIMCAKEDNQNEARKVVIDYFNSYSDN
jgi:hypothetical protein